MFKKSFWGFLEILIYFLDLKIQLETILTHKGHLRSRCRCQILGKLPRIQFFSKKTTHTYMLKMSFHSYRFLRILNWLLTLFLSLETSSAASQTYEMTSWAYMCCFFLRKTGFFVIFREFDICNVTLSNLYGSKWSLIESLSPESKSVPPKTPKTTF